MSRDSARCACGIVPTLAPADRKEALALCHMMVGARGELDRYRAAYDRQPDYLNLFPMVYWHTTSVELQRLAVGGFQHPLPKLRQLLIFYDAYRANRDQWEATGTAEPHWQRHFRAARSADLTYTRIAQVVPAAAAIKQVLMSGFSAHIDYDLPRALRDSFGRCAGATPAQLQQDYFDTAPTLLAASTSATSQLMRGIRKVGGPLVTRLASVLAPAAVQQFHAEVMRMRNNAWRLAASDRALPTGGTPSPSTDHVRLEELGLSTCRGHARGDADLSD
jgi:hypothetical protein